MADWAALPSDAVRCVAQKLKPDEDVYNFINYVEMRAVCSPWRNAIQEPRASETIIERYIQHRILVAEKRLEDISSLKNEAKRKADNSRKGMEFWLVSRCRVHQKFRKASEIHKGIVHFLRWNGRKDMELVGFLEETIKEFDAHPNRGPDELLNAAATIADIM